MTDGPKPLNSSTTSATMGFWLYLMTDCLLFGSLFASFVVLRGQTAGGVSGQDIFDLPYVFLETMILLLSSLASGLALFYALRRQKTRTLFWLTVTAVLGTVFLAMEIHEFIGLVSAGHSWAQSAFLSAYFGLVGTHGLHITAGLIWLGALILFVLRRGFSDRLAQRLVMFTMFWHFLDIVWVCIFTIVYLLGVL